MSLNDTIGVTTLGGKGPHRRWGSPGWTAIAELGRIDELADGMGASVDAVTGTAIGPYRKSPPRGLGIRAKASWHRCLTKDHAFHQCWPWTSRSISPNPAIVDVAEPAALGPMR